MKGFKPPPPSVPPPSNAKRAPTSLNPVRKQPRPAESPQGTPEYSSEAEAAEYHVRKSSTGRSSDSSSTDDKKSPMVQVQQAMANLWSWAKEKGSKLRNKGSVAKDQPTQTAPEIPFKARLDNLIQMLEGAAKLDRKTIVKHAFQYGAPERPGCRSTLWKLLLDYIPYDRSLWDKVLKEKRMLYREWVGELVTNPYKKLFRKKMQEKEQPEKGGSEKPKEEGKGGGGQTTAPVLQSLVSVESSEDPLNAMTTPNSDWDHYYKDEELREEIHKDVMRTYASFSFFMQRVRNPSVASPPLREKNNSQKNKEEKQQGETREKNNKKAAEGAAAADGAGVTPGDQAKDTAEPKEDTEAAAPKKETAQATPEKKLRGMPSLSETHHDVIQRILFIYAKLNPGVRYVQGMNEILAPIYFTFAQDPNPSFKIHAEADAFFCFSNLMTEIRDRFVRELDCTSAGIIAAVKDLNDLLQKVDPKLHSHLRTLNIDPRFYAFRWLTLLLSQEFELPDTLRLWDSLFADEKRFDYLTYCCVSMLYLYRDRLLAGGFAEGLRMLQDYPPTDLTKILACASYLIEHVKFELQTANGQQLVMPIDLDKHLGLEGRRRKR